MARARRSLVVLATCVGASTAFLLTAAEASAHVTVSSTSATQGGFAVITVNVPTESDTASTTQLAVTLPLDNPIASVSVQPHTGWSFTVKKTKLSQPVTTDDGEVTEAISEIDWKADSAATAIKPGEFDRFNISAGPLPKVETLTFKAIQTYSDGKIVKWIEVPAAGSETEPEFPAPTLKLAAAAAETSATTTNQPTVTAVTRSDASGKASTGAATTGIVLGALGLVLGAGALLISLRRRRQAA
jgi:uncharacterized protein